VFGWKKNICGYWDCQRRIANDQFLCADHHQSWTDGIIDRCPNCGRFKDIMYQQCQDCYFGRKVTPWQPSVEIANQEQSYRVDYSETWTDGYMQPERYFVYIIGFGEGDFYVGHTADIRKRLAEHREGKIFPTSGGITRLEYLEVAADEKAALLREAELKRLIEINPNQLRLMTSRFVERMRELGFLESD
jgi:predicted GIY-YIG superfamily endonuclease